jgi:hypothetical protein
MQAIEEAMKEKSLNPEDATKELKIGRQVQVPIYNGGPPVKGVSIILPMSKRKKIED